MDGSGSVNIYERPYAIEFAIDTVSAFAELNLFQNGGTASYVEFATDVTEGHTFTSQDDFDEHVEDAPRMADTDYTNIIDGIAKGQEVLPTSFPGTTSIMVVITDGAGTTRNKGDPTDPTVRFGVDASRARRNCPLARPRLAW